MDVCKRQSDELRATSLDSLYRDPGAGVARHKGIERLEIRAAASRPHYLPALQQPPETIRGPNIM